MNDGRDHGALIEALRRRNRELESRLLEMSTLYHVSKALSLSVLTENLLDITAAIFAEVFRARAFSLYLDDPNRKLLFPIALHQRESGGRWAEAVGYDHPVIGAAFREGAGRLYRGGELAELWADAPASFTGTVLVTPLKSPEGGRIGVMCVAGDEAEPLERTDMFEDVAEHVAVAIENARFIGEARALSTVDPLTDLYNRRYLDDRLAREIHRAARYERTFSLAILDVDRFKSINDRFGHDAGDRVLIRLAELLRATVRQSDVVVRYGGDEFVILLPETAKDEAATAVEHFFTRIRSEPAGVGEPEAFPRVSAGISSFPLDADRADALLRKADRALYRAKGQGGDRVVVADAKSD